MSSLLHGEAFPKIGALLGLDVGKSRIGISRSDPHRILASPLGVVPRIWEAETGGFTADLQEICRLAGEHKAIAVVVGLPLSLSGRHTASTDDAHNFAQALATQLPLPVISYDERLTTVQATRQLRASGKNSRQIKQLVDTAAATELLQRFLEQKNVATV